MDADTTQHVETDREHAEDDAAVRARTSAVEVPGPPSAGRVDVRRRVMALRRW